MSEAVQEKPEEPDDTSTITTKATKTTTTTNATTKPRERLVFTVIGEMEDEDNIDFSLQGIFEDTLFLKRNYHFAVTGKVFQIIQNKYPNLYTRLLVCGTIFSRMLPDQKTSLVEGRCLHDASECIPTYAIVRRGV